MYSHLLNAFLADLPNLFSVSYSTFILLGVEADSERSSENVSTAQPGTGDLVPLFGYSGATLTAGLSAWTAFKERTSSQLSSLATPFSANIRKSTKYNTLILNSNSDISRRFVIHVAPNYLWCLKSLFQFEFWLAELIHTLLPPRPAILDYNRKPGNQLDHQVNFTVIFVTLL